MAGSVNKVVLIGNIGRDPEVRAVGNGAEKASFSVATTETWKDKGTGDKKEKTEWHRVVTFNQRLIDVLKTHVKKGSKLYIEGQLQTRKWIDEESQERHSTEIVLQNFNSQLILLGAPNNSSISHSPQSTPIFDNNELDDDEIPF